MRKLNEENERIKRKHAQWLRDAEGRDHATIDIALAAILRFERSTDFKSFKLFNLDQPAAFKATLGADKNQRTGKPLSKATIDATLRHVKKFFHWLAGESGYKSRIKYSHAAYFNNNAKDARAAHAKRNVSVPTMEQCNHAFRLMPCSTDIERRNKAMFAFLMLTTIRDGAMASLRLKHIDLVEGAVFQDGRDVDTKGSKTFMTWFLPLDKQYQECLFDWVTYLRTEKLFGHDDPVFPKPLMGIGETGGFKVIGLSRGTYSNGTTICRIIKEAFKNADLPVFGPHTFRKTLTKYGGTLNLDWEGLKAWSLNLGHENIATTLNAYFPVAADRQGEIIKNMRG